MRTMDYRERNQYKDNIDFKKIISLATVLTILTYLKIANVESAGFLGALYISRGYPFPWVYSDIITGTHIIFEGLLIDLIFWSFISFLLISFKSVFSSRDTRRKILKTGFVIGGLIFVILLGSNSIRPENGRLKFDTSNLRQKVTEKIPAKIESSLETCENKARELIPNSIKMYTNPISNYDDWDLMRDLVYNDGTKIVVRGYEFKKGSLTGENINYYYSEKNFNSERYPMTYSRQITDNDGKILGTRVFKFAFALKPIEGSESKFVASWNNYGYLSKDFEIRDINFVECNWVE